MSHILCRLLNGSGGAMKKWTLSIIILSIVIILEILYLSFQTNQRIESITEHQNNLEQLIESVEQNTILLETKLVAVKQRLRNRSIPNSSLIIVKSSTPPNNSSYDIHELLATVK